MRKILITIAKIGGVALIAGAAIYGAQYILKKMSGADGSQNKNIATVKTAVNNEESYAVEDNNSQSVNLYEEKSRVCSTISSRHQEAANLIREMLADDTDEQEEDDNVVDNIIKIGETEEKEKVDFDEIDNCLDKLLDEE